MPSQIRPSLDTLETGRIKLGRLLTTARNRCLPQGSLSLGKRTAS